jgi:hypothetical protein
VKKRQNIIGCFFKIYLIVGVEESIVNARHGLLITDQLIAPVRDEERNV